jgi:hypothetical protein
MIEIKGGCFGVRIDKPLAGGEYEAITLMVEDDENWFDKVSFSGFWLEDIIAVLQEAKDYLATLHKVV